MERLTANFKSLEEIVYSMSEAKYGVRRNKAICPRALKKKLKKHSPKFSEWVVDTQSFHYFAGNSGLVMFLREPVLIKVPKNVIDLSALLVDGFNQKFFRCKCFGKNYYLPSSWRNKEDGSFPHAVYVDPDGSLWSKGDKNTVIGTLRKGEVNLAQEAKPFWRVVR